MSGFDYVIVGAGSAGCVLAARLSEDRDVRVLLLEAGGSDRSLQVRMPLAWFGAMRNPRLNWGYLSEPEPHADGRRIPAPRGKLLGGCSSINGMMYSRGHPADYDQWAQMGARGWSHAEVLPYFRRSEANWRGATEHHGADGPLTVSALNPDRRLYQAMIRTADAMGFRHLPDFHGDDREGFSMPEVNTHRGRRASTSARFLRPALTRPNLTVISGALVARVTLENGRATGVDYVVDGVSAHARAEREVILSAGAFNSPQLLLLSGIGPADELRAAGVAPLHDLPGVGRNLQDHASIHLIFDAAGPVTFDPQLRLDRMAVAAARWWLAGTGPLAEAPIAAQGFVRTREGLDRPDNQFLISTVAMDAKVWFPGWRQRRGDVFMCSNVLLHPDSRGSVTLRSADPADKPRIQFNLLAAESDRLAFRRFVRFTRDFFATEPACSLVTREALPGPAVQSDAEVDAFVRSRVGTAMHPTSSCAIGTGVEAVVDAQLRVRGVEGLRVVDCSVMPVIVGGNTNAPAIMIAEKAADLIRGRTALAEAA